ncbi:hypothetical protein JIN84_22000 [Luteolibacter yonseiensis]|uniref:Uncharacterized protein n=1 Tax=Luteolibacter yonseiensis TaxID=1144680 RepID=A0A934R7B1_9BACT|nr:hypothetical protein [Luteolibacter yonseiensis]MBK1818309.1 hypothetical protein [Luteolibacter yonseiensis]
MRYLILLCGLVILAMGGVAMATLAKTDGQGFLYGALQLGGGLLICGIFTFRMPWHGIIGAGVISLLGTARGLGNVPGLVKFLGGNRDHGTTPLLELGVTLICCLLMLRVLVVLQRERVRRMLEQGE